MSDPSSEAARSRFQRYAWGLVAYNLVVILGGAYVRASVSGDGCGQHWPTCLGEIMPAHGRLETFIELGHRFTSGLLLPLGILLVVWSRRLFPAGHQARLAAGGVLGLTIAEALVGAGLVLFKLVAHDRSVYRGIVMPTHLVLTLSLLMTVALAAWSAGGGSPILLRGQGTVGRTLVLGLLLTMGLGVSGALTALGDTLFPAPNLAEGLRQDFSPSAHFLVQQRVYHPLIAMSVGLYLLLAAGLAMRLRPAEEVRKWGSFVILMLMVQMGAGALNLALLAPIWMQLVHLLLADLLWIGLVLLSASALREGVERAELPGAAGAGTAQARAGWKDYLALTKPRVISLLVFTTLTAMFIAAGVEGSSLPSIWLCLAVGLGFCMSAGSANAINMVLERDLDLRMGRTASRPTVTRRVPPQAALRFAFLLWVGSFLLLWGAANLLSAMLATAGLAFYVIVYTILLKRRSWTNIVIGGAAGAFPPLIGWAGVTGDLSALAWVLFGIIFLWTPVHFWALAILLKEDYALAGVPMLPVVRGERATATQIAAYGVLTAALSLAPVVMQGRDGQALAGWLYLGGAVLLNAGLLSRCARLYRRPDHTQARSMFKYSMVYLALLFLTLAVDSARWN